MTISVQNTSLQITGTFSKLNDSMASLLDSVEVDYERLNKTALFLHEEMMNRHSLRMADAFSPLPRLISFVLASFNRKQASEQHIRVYQKLWLVPIHGSTNLYLLQTCSSVIRVLWMFGKEVSALFGVSITVHCEA